MAHSGFCDDGSGVGGDRMCGGDGSDGDRAVDLGLMGLGCVGGGGGSVVWARNIH